MLAFLSLVGVQTRAFDANRAKCATTNQRADLALYVIPSFESRVSCGRRLLKWGQAASGICSQLVRSTDVYLVVSCGIRAAIGAEIWAHRDTGEQLRTAGMGLQYHCNRQKTANRASRHAG